MFFQVITLSLIVDTNFVTSYKSVGAGCATISIAGSGVGIGVLFSGLLSAFSRNPDVGAALFNYAVLGFAFTEAIALFGLMMSLLILYT